MLVSIILVNHFPWFIIFPKHPSVGQEKASQRLTDAGESVTIKAQKEVLPIDGQPQILLLKQKVTASFGRGRLLFCVIYVSNQD